MSSPYEKYNIQIDNVPLEGTPQPTSEEWEEQINFIEANFEEIKNYFIKEAENKDYLNNSYDETALNIVKISWVKEMVTKYPYARAFIQEKLKENNQETLKRIKKKPPTELDIKIMRALTRK